MAIFRFGFGSIDLDSERESDLRDLTLRTGAGGGFLISMLEKLDSLFNQSNNIGGVHVKMYGSILEEKSSFKKLGFDFIF